MSQCSASAVPMEKMAPKMTSLRKWPPWYMRRSPTTTPKPSAAAMPHLRRPGGSSRAGPEEGEGGRGIAGDEGAVVVAGAVEGERRDIDVSALELQHIHRPGPAGMILQQGVGQEPRADGEDGGDIEGLPGAEPADRPAEQPGGGGQDEKRDAETDPVGRGEMEQLRGPRERQEEPSVGAQHVAADRQIQLGKDEEDDQRHEEGEEEKEGRFPPHG